MTGYVVYAQDICRAQAEKVKPVVVYLGENYQEMEHSFTQDELNEFAQQIALQTREMYEYCEIAEENIPKSKDNFPRNVRKLCAYCNYQELCGD